MSLDFQLPVSYLQYTSRCLLSTINSLRFNIFRSLPHTQHSSAIINHWLVIICQLHIIYERFFSLIIYVYLLRPSHSWYIVSFLSFLIQDFVNFLSVIVVWREFIKLQLFLSFTIYLSHFFFLLLFSQFSFPVSHTVLLVIILHSLIITYCYR